jgi:hypothetical protein
LIGGLASLFVALAVLLIPLALLVALFRWLGAASPPPAKQLEQRLLRLEGQVAALVLRFERLELRLNADPDPTGAPAPTPPAAPPTPPPPPPAVTLPGRDSSRPPERPSPQPPPARREAVVARQQSGPAPDRQHSNLAPPGSPQRLPPATELPKPGPARTAARRPGHPPSLLQQRWRQLERRLIANWTGLLGVVVIVAGVTFAAINVALTLNAGQRFLALVAVAVALALPSLLQHGRSRWSRLSSWMRSGSGALLLFACTAAGGLPQLGLQWVFDPRQALALLCAAVTVNLVLAVTAANETVAALHVVVSLVPLAIVPQGALILGVASSVALVGQVLPLGRPWHGHRVLVALAYGLFHGAWVMRALPQLAAADALRDQAALAAALVFGGGTLLLQRPQRLLQQPPALPLAAQLLNAGGLGLALLLEPSQPIGRAGALAVAAGVFALLARRAGRAELHWLRRCDVALAQAFSLGALLSLGPLLANRTLLCFVVLLECLLFLQLAAREDDGFIRQLGWWLSLSSVLALGLTGLAEAFATLNSAWPISPAGIGEPGRPQISSLLLVGGGLCLGTHSWLEGGSPHADAADRPALPLPDLMGWLVAALLWMGASVILMPAWQPLITPLVLGGALLVGRRWDPPGLVAGLAVAIAVVHLESWKALAGSLPWAPQSLAGGILPALVLALLLLWDARRPRWSGLGWLLLCLSAGWWGMASLAVIAGRSAPASLAGHAVVLLGGGTLIGGLQLAMIRWRIPQPSPALMGWLAPGLLLLGSLGCLPKPWGEPVAALVLQATLLVGRRLRPAGLLAGTAAATGAFLLVSWIWLVGNAPWAWPQLLPRLLPVLLACQLLFLRQEDGPRRTGWLWLQGSALVLLICSIQVWARTTELDPIRAATVLCFGQLLALLEWQLQRTAIALPAPALLGLQAAVLTYAGAGLAIRTPWQGVAGLVGFGSLLLMARAWRPRGLLVGAGLGVTLLHAQLWLQLLQEQPCAPLRVAGDGIPLTALALLLLAVARQQARLAVPLAAAAIYLLGFGAGLAAWLLLEPVSSLIPPVAWLLLALPALELAARLRALLGRHALICGVGYLLSFALGYVLLISQSPALLALGPVTLRGRFLIELLALAVLLYWWFFPTGRSLAELPLWRNLHPLLIEALVLGVSVTVLSEVSVLWRPVAWSALGLVLISRPLRDRFAARLQIYAVLFYWLGLGTMLAVLGTLQSPALEWFRQPGQIALLAMGLQIGFIVASHRQLDAELLGSCSAWPPLSWIGRRVSNRPHRWLYLPMFAAVAYYLWLRYDRSLLTLLWAAEAFTIYGLSAVLRDAQFRLLALLALGACLVRLVAIDMAQADLGIRGIVFIGVGLLMLGMNALYNRFRSRFEASDPSEPASEDAAGLG